MGPRRIVNEKAEAAKCERVVHGRAQKDVMSMRKERKAAAKDEAKKKADKDAEDAYWRAAGEGAKTKAQAKRDDEDRKRQEAAARKAELKRLQEEEEAAMSRPKPSPKAARVSGPKVTHHELSQMRDAEEAAREAEQRERALAARREVTVESYGRLVDSANTNRQDDAVDARSVEQAIGALAQLSVAGGADSPAADKHPEKRARAAYKLFEEKQLPLLRMEKPNLKQSQYKDLLWKAWLKSPENPMVAAGRV